MREEGSHVAHVMEIKVDPAVHVEEEEEEEG
jgi:hypothetical protein